jgi:hypothetical protein
MSARELTCGFLTLDLTCDKMGFARASNHLGM